MRKSSHGYMDLRVYSGAHPYDTCVRRDGSLSVSVCLQTSRPDRHPLISDCAMSSECTEGKLMQELDEDAVDPRMTTQQEDTRLSSPSYCKLVCRSQPSMSLCGRGRTRKKRDAKQSTRDHTPPCLRLELVRGKDRHRSLAMYVPKCFHQPGTRTLTSVTPTTS